MNEDIQKRKGSIMRDIETQTRRGDAMMAVGDIQRIFVTDECQRVPMKAPAILRCERGGNWKLVECDSREARYTPDQGLNIYVDRALFDHNEGDLDLLVDYAERFYRAPYEEKNEVTGIKKRLPGYCWVKTIRKGSWHKGCDVRARDGKLTCAVHDQYENIAQALNAAMSEQE